jgi:hypothetical protein
MPKGPQGQKRPADVTQNAVHVMRIATGEIEETKPKNAAAAALGKLGGVKGGKARAEKMSAKQRKVAAQKAAKARWTEK